MRSQFLGWRQGLRCESLEDRSLPAGDFLGLSPVVAPVDPPNVSHGHFNDNDNDADDFGSPGVIYVGTPNLPPEQSRPVSKWYPQPMPQPVSEWNPQSVSVIVLHPQPASVSQPGMMPPPRSTGTGPNPSPIHDPSNLLPDSVDVDPVPFHELVIHLDSTAPDLVTRDHLHDKVGSPVTPASAPTVSPLPNPVASDLSHLSNSSGRISNSNFSSIVNTAVVFVAESRSGSNPSGTDSAPVPGVSEGATDARDSAERRLEENERIGRDEIVEFPSTLPALISRAIPVDLSQIEATAQQYLEQIANITTELPEGMDWFDVLWMSSTALFLGGVACVGWIEQSQSRRKRLNTPLVQHLSEIEQPI